MVVVVVVVDSVVASIAMLCMIDDVVVFDRKHVNIKFQTLIVVLRLPIHCKKRKNSDKTILDSSETNLNRTATHEVTSYINNSIIIYDFCFFFSLAYTKPIHYQEKYKTVKTIFEIEVVCFCLPISAANGVISLICDDALRIC